MTTTERLDGGRALCVDGVTQCQWDVIFIKLLGAGETFLSQAQHVGKCNVDVLISEKALPLLDQISFIFGCLSFSVSKKAQQCPLHRAVGGLKGRQPWGPVSGQEQRH